MWPHMKQDPKHAQIIVKELGVERAKELQIHITKPDSDEFKVDMDSEEELRATDVAKTSPQWQVRIT